MILGHCLIGKTLFDCSPRINLGLSSVWCRIELHRNNYFANSINQFYSFVPTVKKTKLYAAWCKKEILRYGKLFLFLLVPAVFYFK